MNLQSGFSDSKLNYLDVICTLDGSAICIVDQYQFFCLNFCSSFDASHAVHSDDTD